MKSVIYSTLRIFAFATLLIFTSKSQLNAAKKFTLSGIIGRIKGMTISSKDDTPRQTASVENQREGNALQAQNAEIPETKIEEDGLEVKQSDTTFAVGDRVGVRFNQFSYFITTYFPEQSPHAVIIQTRPEGSFPIIEGIIDAVIPHTNLIIKTTLILPLQVRGYTNFSNQGERCEIMRGTAYVVNVGNEIKQVYGAVEIFTLPH